MWKSPFQLRRCSVRFEKRQACLESCSIWFEVFNLMQRRCIIIAVRIITSQNSDKSKKKQLKITKFKKLKLE